MGTITAQAIIDKASTTLLDKKAVRWTVSDLLDYLNEAQRNVVLLKPSAYTVNQSQRLAAGTKQTLVEGALMLLDVIRNLGSGGNKPGRPVKRIERSLLDSQVPNWHASRAETDIRHFTYDINDLKTFYCWPPSNGNGYIDILCSVTPPVMAASDSIALDDVYEGALLSFVLYRAFLKEADYASDPTRAASYLSFFMGAVTGKNSVEQAKNPNTDPSGNPNSRAPRS